MQTIARANRVFPGKDSGVIVDYANVFASLEKALAIYGAGKGGKSPVKDKQKLVEELRKSVDAAAAFSRSCSSPSPAEQSPAGMRSRSDQACRGWNPHASTGECLQAATAVLTGPPIPVSESHRRSLEIARAFGDFPGRYVTARIDT
jgi:hypothetical protein